MRSKFIHTVYFAVKYFFDLWDTRQHETSDRVSMNGFQSRASSFRRSFPSRSHARRFLPLSPFVVVTLFQPALMDRLHTLIADFFGRKTSSGQRFNRCRGGGSRQTFIWERESKGGRKSEKEREEEEEWVREGARGVQRAGGSLLVHPGKTRPHRQPLYVDSTRCLVSLIFFLSFSPFFSIRTRRPL